MHFVVIHEELLDSGLLIPVHTVGLISIETKSAEETREGDIVTICTKVDVNLVVHGELIDRVDAILNYLLDDAKAFGVEDENKSSVEASQ